MATIPKSVRDAAKALIDDVIRRAKRTHETANDAIGRIDESIDSFRARPRISPANPTRPLTPHDNYKIAKAKEFIGDASTAIREARDAANAARNAILRDHLYNLRNTGTQLMEALKTKSMNHPDVKLLLEKLETEATNAMRAANRVVDAEAKIAQLQGQIIAAETKIANIHAGVTEAEKAGAIVVGTGSVENENQGITAEQVSEFGFGAAEVALGVLVVANAPTVTAALATTGLIIASDKLIEAAVPVASDYVVNPALDRLNTFADAVKKGDDGQGNFKLGAPKPPKPKNTVWEKAASTSETATPAPGLQP